MKEIKNIEFFDKREKDIVELKEKIERNEREKIILSYKMEDLEDYGTLLKKELEIKTSALKQ